MVEPRLNVPFDPEPRRLEQAVPTPLEPRRIDRIIASGKHKDGRAMRRVPAVLWDGDRVDEAGAEAYESAQGAAVRERRV